MKARWWIVPVVGGGLQHSVQFLLVVDQFAEFINDLFMCFVMADGETVLFCFVDEQVGVFGFDGLIGDVLFGPLSAAGVVEPVHIFA